MTVGLLTEFQAAVLYLLPGAVVLLRISTEKGAMAQAVMWIPAAIAIDLLACLVASWVVPLGVAFLVSRLVWLTLGVELLRRRRWRVERPTADQVRQIGIVVAAGFAAFALSATISRPASIWDRQFHIPLVSMMRGQRLPFLTVFQPNTVLHFHFAGDVMAAGLQVFSFGRLHASLALALAHDLAFGLVGAAMAAWLTTIAPRRLWIVPAVLAIFLSGPFALQRTGLGPLVVGYSYLNLLCMSYRPAVAVAILFLVGAFGAVGLRLSSPEDVPWRRALVVMLSCLAAAGISDEPSAALWGVGLAALWLVQPNVLHAR
ncbi:MAG: hypothetical protein ABUR63_09305, partial [Verrucomicrobiota bacterium]